MAENRPKMTSALKTVIKKSGCFKLSPDKKDVSLCNKGSDVYNKKWLLNVKAYIESYAEVI